MNKEKIDSLITHSFFNSINKPILCTLPSSTVSPEYKQRNESQNHPCVVANSPGRDKSKEMIDIGIISGGSKCYKDR